MSKIISSCDSVLVRIFRMGSSNKQSAQPASQPLNNEPLDVSMPSSCFCEVKVFGPRLALEEFRKVISGFDPTIPSLGPAPFNEFCFSNVIPLANEFTKLNSIIVMEKVRFGLWGTKGNCYGTTLKQNPHSLRYHFAVWESPPLPVFEKMIRTNAHLKFRVEVHNPNTGLKMVILGKRGKVFQWTAPNKYAKEKAA